MKNNIIFSLIVALFAFVGSACSDNDDKNDSLAGSWNYSDAYVVFEYMEENVSINLGEGKSLSLPATAVAPLLKETADKYMKDYFEGIDFTTDKDLVIRMKMKDGTKETLKATYVEKNGFLEIVLNADDLKALAGEKLNIPVISLRYKFENGKLIAYMDWKYIQILLNSDQVKGMMDSMIAALMPTFNPAFTLPEEVQASIVAGMKAQLMTIIGKTKNLEVGVVMVPAK